MLWVSRVKLVTHRPLSAFLGATRYVDHQHPAILTLIDGRGWRSLGAVDAARSVFEFVRDEVRHSWDARSHRVTRTASEALVHREGLCFAKSHLLVALLRQLGVPSGLAYQRLTFGDTPETGYMVHGLCTAHVDGRWMRLDARGNKPGIDARFSLDEERIAFTARPEIDERDYEENFCDVHPVVARSLEGEDDLHVLIERLPSTI